MFEKLTKLSREGQRQEGTRTLVRGRDGSRGRELGEESVGCKAASCVKEAKTREGRPAGVGGQV